MNRDEARGGRRTTATRQLRKPAGGRSQTPEPAAIAWPSVSSLADSVACAMSEKRRNAKLRAEQKAEKVAEMKADLLRMYEECKQAGVVVEVGTGDMPAGLRRHASECLASGSRRGASLDILRRSPDAHEDLEGQLPRGGRRSCDAHAASFTFGNQLSTGHRPATREGLAQRISARQLSKGQRVDAQGALDKADGVADAVLRGDPLRKDVCDESLGRKGGREDFMGWLRGAYQRACVFIPRARRG